MSESLEKGGSVTSVSATDNDTGMNARLSRCQHDLDLVTLNLYF